MSLPVTQITQNVPIGDKNAVSAFLVLRGFAHARGFGPHA
jgi:hypothetical protein